ncbi:discoidin domain-containing protein [Actinoplanes sp. NPDC020271]|uniref:galactose-binding domain-containing protein n=1 Tax=Actinoplanes sp. NPDC020271 TaxID=3363896 RepID=UPI00379B6CF4
MIRLAAVLLAVPGGLTVLPGSLTITTGPCNGRDLAVQLTNNGTKGLYAEASLTASDALHLPRRLITSWLPAGYTTSVPVTVTGTRTGSYHVRVTRDDRVVDVPVEVTVPPADAGLTALATRVTASTARATGPVCAAIDGRADTMWNDATGKRWPDWWQLDWPTSHQVSSVAVTTAAEGGLRDWDVQVAVPGGWATVAAVRANVSAFQVARFPPRQTSAVRIVTLAGNAVNDQSRLVEVVVGGR